METWIIHYTVEKMDQCTDLEIDITVPNIDFVLPEFRRQVRLFKKIDAVIRKPNIKPKTESNEQF
jgi:hypothetical protein